MSGFPMGGPHGDHSSWRFPMVVPHGESLWEFPMLLPIALTAVEGVVARSRCKAAMQARSVLFFLMLMQGSLCTRVTRRWH